MKIIYFGTPEFALAPLESLYNDPEIEILAVVTQADKKIGRKQIVNPPPVKILAERLGIKVIQAKNKKELSLMLKPLKADFFVVIAFGMILNEEILKMPRIASINVHASLLPKYRGASPIQEAILNGDKETGISIMQMDEELDHGGVYLIKKLAIEKNDTTNLLSKKLSFMSAEMLPHALKDIMESGFNPIPQNEKNATYCKKIQKTDGKINWTKSAEEIKNMIKAFTPWPSTYTEIDNKKLKIIEAEISEEKNTIGKFIIEGKRLKIGTAKGTLIPIKVQMEGKREMEIKEFLNGFKPPN